MLSIIIVNYKSEKYLEKCISSVKEEVLGVEYEIIVVNNDEVAGNAYMRSLPAEIQVINTGKNIGFGAACNLGAKNAHGEILWFLNPDTEIISESITEFQPKADPPLAEILKLLRKGSIGVIGPRLIDDKNKTQEWIAGREVTLLSILLNNLGYKRDKKIWESKKLIECAWISGASMFVRKDVFKKVGGFDEKFFMYFEDIDLCKRIRQIGYKTLYFPEFTIKHFGGGSFIGKIKQKKCYYRSQARYFLG